jgi:Concanavalin A-like lectin/glucanases superfamily
MFAIRRSTMGVQIGLAGGSLLGLGCGDSGSGSDSLSKLMADGDVGAVAAGAAAAPAAMTAPPRFCPNGDCTGSPLAFWTLDDCNPQSTTLADSATTSQTSHPAFRAVSAACVASIDAEGIRLSKADDIIYAPDQPDFLFNKGLTVAAWIKPDSLSGTQSIARKRLDDSSAFVLAIDGGKLTFALRLTNGKTVGISAAIKAKRFTHVAATYDGRLAVLYVDGAAAASAKATGTIAPGVGPVFVGNDADGRELGGIVDDIWLNTLAAPASVIQGLTCIRSAPVVVVTPGTTPAEVAGTSVAFDVAITNSDGASCPADTFFVFPQISYPLTTPGGFGTTVTIAPGQTVHIPSAIGSSKMASVGSYGFGYLVESQTASQIEGQGQATYVVGTGPISCDGQAPFTPQITDSFSGPVYPFAAPYTFNSPVLAAPVATVIPAPDGSIHALQISANPGSTTDLANNYLGVGFPFFNPSCLDASAYTGVQFTVAGDLGTCSLRFTLVTSEDQPVMYGGICTAASCVSPMSGPLTVGTNVVNFSDINLYGAPLPTIDPAALNSIQWQLLVPTDGVTAPCVANFTVSNVSFVPSTLPPPPPPPGTGGSKGPGGGSGFAGAGGPTGTIGSGGGTMGSSGAGGATGFAGIGGGSRPPFGSPDGGV